MLVEIVQPKAPAKTVSRSQQKAGYSVLDNAARERHVAKHIEELQRDNYNEVKFESDTAQTQDKKKQTLAVRKILASRKTLRNHLDEVGGDAALSVPLPNSSYPARKLCAICGYWAAYSCYKCGLSSCSMACETAHRETRCQRR